MSSEWNKPHLHDDSRNWLHPREKGRANLIKQRLAIVKALQAKEDERFRPIIDALSNCREDSRCDSGACPECRTAFKRHMRRKIKKAFGGTGGLIMCTVIPTTENMMPSNFKEAAQCDWRLWLETLLANAGMESMPIIAGLDVSLNVFHDEEGKEVSRYVCPHVCFFTCDREPKVLTQMLTEASTPHPLVIRKVLTKRVARTPMRARSYCVKGSQDEIHYLFGKSDGVAKALRQTLKREIKNSRHPQFCDLIEYLHLCGLPEITHVMNIE